MFGTGIVHLWVMNDGGISVSAYFDLESTSLERPMVEFIAVVGANPSSSCNPSSSTLLFAVLCASVLRRSKGHTFTIVLTE